MKNTEWYIAFKEFLKANGKDTKIASQEMGIPYSTLGSYLCGTRSPSDRNKEKIYEYGFDIYNVMYSMKREN